MIIEGVYPGLVSTLSVDSESRIGKRRDEKDRPQMDDTNDGVARGDMGREADEGRMPNGVTRLHESEERKAIRLTRNTSCV